MIYELKLNSGLRSLLDASSILFCHRKDQRRTKSLSTVIIDSQLAVEPYVGIYSGFNLSSVGAFSYTNSPLPVDMKVGRYCSIGSGLKILGFSHPLDRISTSPFTYSAGNEFFARAVDSTNMNDYIVSQPQKNTPIIENDVWIGANVTLSKGITIHSGSIVAANSLVTKDVPPYAIVGGNPATIIKYRFSHELIQESLNFKWWDFHVNDIVSTGSNNLSDVINILSQRSNPRFSTSHITAEDLLALVD